MSPENFDFTPKAQPFPEDPVVFTLRPLDQRGLTNMNGARVMMRTDMAAMGDVAVRYIIGWRGGKQEPVTDPDRRLEEVRNSATPNMYWMAWLTQISNELLSRAKPKEEDAKKF
jgi:hypothetical protein